jgi:hypothetical protein
MKRSGPLPVLIAGTLIVGLLCTALVHDGWLIWVPALGAIAIASAVGAKLGH